MARERDHTYGHQRVTLKQTLLMALLLHLALAGVAQWQPDLLWSAPVVTPPDRAEPLEFRFVDVPESEPPEETPDTEALSDRDREARDASERDDAADPFSEGNTSQEVLRTPPTASTPAAEPVPETPPVETEVPLEERPEETAPEEAESTGEEAAREPEAEAPEPDVTETRPGPGDVAPEAETARPPVSLPPAQPDLRSTMSRLNTFVDAEAYDNPEGGTDGEEGLVNFDTKGYELGPYINEVLRIIERNWKMNIPAAASLPGMEGATFVRLSIRRVRDDAGQETARIVVHRTWTSGKRSFDQAAVFALDVSNPLPPIPSFFPYDSLDGRIGFLYNLTADEVTFPPGG